MSAAHRGVARLWLWIFLAGLALAVSQQACAEPYLAVQQGFKCMVCHTSPSGGGQRNAFGNVFAQQTLPAHRLRDAGSNLWTGAVLDFLSIGADVRGGFSEIQVPGQPDNETTELEELLGYLELRLLPNRLSIHADARLAPDDALERELYVRLSSSDGRFYVRGGDIFLPYGLRLQDDSAFIRQVPGINFNSPDTGWEAGLEHGQWSAQFAVTRGTAGGPEIDSGKQYSLRLSYVTSRWRLGGSLNLNDAAIGDRQMQNLFAGLRTGRVAWLAEVDLIIDDASPTGRRESFASFAEANVALMRGHNIKLSFEYFDPDRDVSEDQQNRLSLVWEYFPFEFVQTRIGLRSYSGIPQNPAQNRDELFVELHAFF
jgi:hypothetical protein